jgi:MoxR-like ATPase
MSIDIVSDADEAARARPGSLLPSLGVYGFCAVETVILAALVTEDPLLLIGKSGTGKTFLLNSLSEALSLEHRHYNASLISFDDLVGFPFPEQDSGTVRFLETPATVWTAQSVLIDELSRCKPEHQNRLFSLIHERRVQGLPLPNLRYRWAAMNPPSSDQNGSDDYTGSEALDPALADRFGLFVTAADWADLDANERLAITNPAGEGKIADDKGRLANKISQWRQSFLAQIETCPHLILTYVTGVVSHLNTAAIRISPRRARLIARSLLAASIIEGATSSPLFRRVLESSLPQATYGAAPGLPAIRAAHRAAWDGAVEAADAWVHQFLAEPSLAAKVDILIKAKPSPDKASQAIAQFLAQDDEARRLAFSFAVYPAATAGVLGIGSEGVNDLAKVAAPILSVDGQVDWVQPNYPGAQPTSPTSDAATAFAKVLKSLTGARLERAKQFFNYCLVNRISLKSASRTEKDINAIIVRLRRELGQ